MILYCLITSLVNALASAVLGLSVLLKDPRDRRNRVFGVFTLSVAVWSIFYHFWQAADTPAAAEFHSRAFSVAAVFIPLCYYHFSTVLAGRDSPRIRLELRLGYATAALFGALSFSGWMITGVEPRDGFPHWPVPGPVYPVYLAHFFYFTVRTLSVLFRAYRGAVAAARARLGYVFYSTAIGFAGGSTNFFLWYDVPVPPVGNGLVAAYIFVVSYVVVRYRLLEADYVVVKAVIVGAAVCALSLALPGALALLEWATELDTAVATAGFIATWGAGLFVTALLYAFVPRLREGMESFIERRLLPGKLGYRGQLRDFTRGIFALRDEGDIFRESVKVVTQALGTSRAAILVRGELDLAYLVRHETGFGGDFRAGQFIDGEHAALRLARHAHNALLLDELRTGGDPEARRAAAELQREHHVEVVVPVLADGTLFGALLLGARTGGRAYSDSDLSLLDALCLQIALSLRSRQLERRMNQTEKLISLGTLAAGLAHELRNPLVSIRTFTDLLAENAGDAEFQREFQAVVQRDVARIATIVENVSAFAENNQVVLAPVSMAEVIRAVHGIAKQEFRDAGVEFDFEPGEWPPVRGNFGQLSQVFLNLFQNAIHAMAGRSPARLSVRAQVHPGGSGPGLLRTEVTDTGSGIPPEMLPRIFDPFVTTKATGSRAEKRGMGLGLAIVKRIIDGHHGQIEVLSWPGRGTTFAVTLPLWEDALA